jgi:hypothetical protein
MGRAKGLEVTGVNDRKVKLCCPVSLREVRVGPVLLFWRGSKDRERLKKIKG